MSKKIIGFFCIFLQYISLHIETVSFIIVKGLNWPLYWHIGLYSFSSSDFLYVKTSQAKFNQHLFVIHLTCTYCEIWQNYSIFAQICRNTLPRRISAVIHTYLHVYIYYILEYCTFNHSYWQNFVNSFQEVWNGKRIHLQMQRRHCRVYYKYDTVQKIWNLHLN
jgi:hypothetical protein